MSFRAPPPLTGRVAGSVEEMVRCYKAVQVLNYCRIWVRGPLAVYLTFAQESSVKEMAIEGHVPSKDARVKLIKVHLDD